jgi:hypothetical protein
MRNIKLLMLVVGNVACLIRLGHFFYVYFELSRTFDALWRTFDATWLYAP